MKSRIPFYIVVTLLTLFSSTSVNAQLSEPQVKLYPNPASSFITIEASDSFSEIQIYDTSGRLLLDEPVDPGTKDVKLNVADFDKGMYIVKITDPNDESGRVGPPKGFGIYRLIIE